MPGTTDTVKAMLTPGEFVIRKEAVDMIGVPILEKLNDMPEAGGHSEIDRLIAQATLKNMTGMYGGGMVNAKQYMGGGKVDMYGHGGKVKNQMMMGYEHGGEAHGNLKPVPDDNPGLAKLPEKVRNKMGYMQDGGSVNSMYNLNELKKLMPMKASNLMGTFDEDQAEVVRKIISGLDISDKERSMLAPKMEKPMGIPTEIESELLRRIISGDSLSTEEQQNFTPRMSPLGMQEGGMAYIDPADSSIVVKSPEQSKMFKELISNIRFPSKTSRKSQLETLIDILNNPDLYGMNKKDSSLLDSSVKNMELEFYKDILESPKAELKEDSLMGMMYGGKAKKKKKYGYQEGGAVQDDAMMLQYLQSLQAQQANPFVPFDQRPPSSGEMMSPIPSDMEQGDMMRIIRDEREVLDMEDANLLRKKAQNALMRFKLDSIMKAEGLQPERLESMPADTSEFMPSSLMFSPRGMGI